MSTGKVTFGLEWEERISGQNIIFQPLLYSGQRFIRVFDKTSSTLLGAIAIDDRGQPLTPSIPKLLEAYNNYWQERHRQQHLKHPTLPNLERIKSSLQGRVALLYKCLTYPLQKEHVLQNAKEELLKMTDIFGRALALVPECVRMFPLKVRYF